MFVLADEDDVIDHEPVYVEFPEEVLQLRVEDLAKRVSKLEKEFFDSFTIQELEFELTQCADDDDEIYAKSYKALQR